MKKTIPQYQYQRLLALYAKLNHRLEKHFSTGRFVQFTKAQQAKLIQRLEKLKAKLQRFEAGLKLAGTAFALSSVLFSGEVKAQFVTNGDPFHVNLVTADNQNVPAVAMDSDGNFVMVWQSNNQDGDGTGIYAQRYNAAGNPLLTEDILVNTLTTGTQWNPAIAMNSNGDFVITWESDPLGGNREIYARIYNALGVAQDPEFPVNTTTSGNQLAPKVAMDSDGDFVITWQSIYQDGSEYGIYAQRFNAAGVKQTTEEFLVNTTTDSDQKTPGIAMDSDGDFVITWATYHDGSYSEVYAQRYNASGVADALGEIVVNSSSSGYNVSPSVAMDSDGDFVIAWSHYIDDVSYYDIYAQRYNAVGVRQTTEEFQVNSYTTDYQYYPAVAMDSDGDFIISWQSDNQVEDYDIFARTYNVAGVAQEVEEFQVNSYTTNNQSRPAIAMGDNGEFVITWASTWENNANDEVYAQLYMASTTSVQSLTEANLVELYPNPAQDRVFVNIEGEVSVRVLDLSGQLVKATTLDNQSFSIAELKSGLYIIELNKEGATAIKKLVVE